MSPLNQALLAALFAAVLLATILAVSFTPPKPAVPVRPVLVLPGVDVAARAGQPNAWLRATGRASVPDRCRTYLPPRHAAGAVSS